MASTLVVKIPRKSIGNEELIAVPRREYERLLKNGGEKRPVFLGYETKVWKGKKYKAPVYQLYGKAAERLDQEVREARAEYKTGKTRKIKSLAELD